MELSLMEKFADPALFDSLTTSEKAIGALITTCMGMGITFIVLILLWAVIVVMSKFVAKTQKAAVKITSANAADSIAVQNQMINDTELVAVITAAIAAYEGDSGLSANNLVVRRITRITGNAWANAGMAECLESRKVY
nr:OadG family protein [uncultured Aminipila sp.]